MFSVPFARGLLKAHIMPSFKLRQSGTTITIYLFKAILHQMFYSQKHPKWGILIHWCPHMAERGNSLKSLNGNIQSSCKLIRVRCIAVQATSGKILWSINVKVKILIMQSFSFQSVTLLLQNNCLIVIDSIIRN